MQNTYLQYQFISFRFAIVSILGAFAKLGKATFSFVMFVCLYAWNKSDPPMDGFSLTL